MQKDIIKQGDLHYCPYCGQPDIQTNYYFSLLHEQLDQQYNQFNFYETYFQPIGIIGSGSFGQVVKVIHHIKDINLNTYAIKQIPIGENQKPYLLRALNEVQTLQKIQHENIVKYNYCFIENIKMAINIEQKQQCLNIVLEFCKGGSLENLLPSRLGRKLNEQEYLNISVQCLKAINHLHKQGMLHRDIKLANFLLTGILPEVKAQEYIHQVYENPLTVRHQTQYYINKKNFSQDIKLQFQSDQLAYIRLVGPQNIIVKLSDFGQQNESAGISAGTELFMSQKVAINQKHSQQTDLYSLGLSLMWLLTETPINEDITQFQHQVKKDFQSIQGISRQVKKIITNMVDEDTLLSAQNYLDQFLQINGIKEEQKYLGQNIIQYDQLYNNIMYNNGFQQKKTQNIQQDFASKTNLEDKSQKQQSIILKLILILQFAIIFLIYKLK